MAILLDRFEERAVAFQLAAMRAALWQEYISRMAGVCWASPVPSPTRYLTAHPHLNAAARHDCCDTKNQWHAWFLHMKSTHNLSITPVRYANMEAVYAASAEKDRALLCAWGKLQVVIAQCGTELLMSTPVRRRTLIATETARLYALRNVFKGCSSDKWLTTTEI